MAANYAAMHPALTNNWTRGADGRHTTASPTTLDRKLLVLSRSAEE